MIDRIKIAVLAVGLLLCGFINAFAASESDEAGNLGVDINGFPAVYYSDELANFKDVLIAHTLGYSYTWEWKKPYDYKEWYVRSVDIDFGEDADGREGLLQRINRADKGSLINTFRPSEPWETKRQEKLYLMSRPFTEAELEEIRSQYDVEVDVRPMAREALVFLVNQTSPVTGLTSGQIQDIFGLKIVDWSAVGGDSGDIMTCHYKDECGLEHNAERYFGLKESYPDGLYPRQMRGLSNIGDPFFLLRVGEIAYTSYGETVNNRCSAVRALTVDGVDATPSAIEDGSYAFTTTAYVAVSKGISEESAAYKLFTFLSGESGSSLIEEAGLVPYYTNGGVSELGQDEVVVETYYTDLRGIRYDEPVPGVMVKTERYANGLSRHTKTYVSR